MDVGLDCSAIHFETFMCNNCLIPKLTQQQQEEQE